MTTTLTKKQTRTRRAEYTRSDGKRCLLVAKIRHDDECNNGYNTFAITGELYEPDGPRHESKHKLSNGRTAWLTSCGCLHNLIGEHFPDLAPLIKWHLTSTDGPMHYAANARYWAGHSGYCKGGPHDPPNWDHFKSTVIWGACPEHDTGNPADRFGNPGDAAALEDWLSERFPALMAAFKTVVESQGFIY